jgi:uncharacterized alkaline shock family protein YloU
MYVNDQRAVDLNQVDLKPWSRAVLDFTSDSPVELGTVRIAPGVLATIAGLTALSVPGVARMSGDMVSGVSKLLGRPDALSGVKIQVKDDAVWVELHLVAEPETNLYQLSTQVQRDVAQAIDKMVGMTVRQVDVYIEDVE